MEESITILGIMSGTSLDGVDLALCTFSSDGSRYEILKAQTLPYDDDWKRNLLSAERCSGSELIKLHRSYGSFLGKLAAEFLSGCVAPNYVSSHGHTIFHEPSRGLTFQLGCGAELAVASGINTISDFRTTDVARQGQGAPLVPIGDQMLFGDFTYCLNLGGFINVSYEGNGMRIAYDIVPLNYVLNRIAQREGKPYDDCGEMARSGKNIPLLEQELNAREYYHQAWPKSLGREWVENTIFPLLKSEYASADILHSFCIHAAHQVAKSCTQPGKMLVTGGGVYNSFFIDELKKACECKVVIPKSETIEFKEALIFAYLGFLRVNEKSNSLASATGAMANSSSGSIYLA